MDANGISPADREARNITFHSARRFFNTLLRHEKVADSIIRRFTGHDSDEMTEHYTDYLPEDMQEISRAQSRLLLGEIRE
jgi:integrase